MVYADPVNLTTPLLLMNYTNNVSGGYLYSGIVMSFFAITMLWFKSRGYALTDCLITASFLSLIISSFLLFMVGSDIFSASFNIVWIIIIVGSVLGALWEAKAGD